MQATRSVSGGYLFSSALGDFLRLRRVGFWLLLAVLVFAIGKGFIAVTKGQSLTETYTQLSSVIVFRILALVAAVFSTSVISQEVEQKTIVYLLTRPVSRAKLLLSRTAAAIASVYVVVLVAAVMASLSIGSSSTAALGRDLAALAMGAVAYTSFFVLISLMVNRAMLICLLFAFGRETAIPNMPGDLYWLSINSYLTGIAQRSTDGAKNAMDVLGGTLNTTTISPMTAWIVMVAFSAACLGLGAWWFTRFEFVPREDAE